MPGLRWLTFSAAAIILGMGLTLSAYAGGERTFSGQVSDSMCGAKHMMPDAAACTRACVSKGSKYALVSGDKVYTLQTEDKAALAELDKLAGQQAKITGDAKGDTIQVSSVAPSH